MTIPAERRTCVAFSGHRTFKIGNDDIAGIKQRLLTAILDSYATGCRVFLCGMAEGFDLIAANAVLTLKDELPDILLVAVIPFRGQAEKFSTTGRQEYSNVINCADRVILLSEDYSKGCFHARNEYLVKHSSRLICYYNGSAGGTRHTVDLARRHWLAIINLFHLQ